MKFAAPLPLKFHWPSRHSVHLLLPLMLMVSGLLHVAGIWVFGLARSEGTPKRVRPAVSYFASPAVGTPADILRSIAARDPSLYSAMASEIPAATPIGGTDYQPLYQEFIPTFEPLPDPAVADLPPIVPRGALTPPRPPLPTFSPAKTVPSRVEFDHALEARLKPVRILLPGTLPKGVAPAPSTFLIAVDPDGHIRFAFPMDSSGSEALDRAALRTLRTMRLREAPGSEAETWGSCTFFWGNDVSKEEN